MPVDYTTKQFGYTIVKDLVYNTNFYNPTAMNHDPRLFDIYWHTDPLGKTRYGISSITTIFAWWWIFL